MCATIISYDIQVKNIKIMAPVLIENKVWNSCGHTSYSDYSRIKYVKTVFVEHLFFVLFRICVHGSVLYTHSVKYAFVDNFKNICAHSFSFWQA